MAPGVPDFFVCLEPHQVEPTRVHTAGLIVALDAAARGGRLTDASRVLLLSAGAGLVAGAAPLVRSIPTNGHV